MNKKNYIDKIELILNTSGKYITSKEKDMILDYVNYLKTKNNVIEDKNIELVIEIERLNNIIDKAIEYIENNSLYEQDYDYDYEENIVELPPDDEISRRILLGILKDSDEIE